MGSSTVWYNASVHNISFLYSTNRQQFQCSSTSVLAVNKVSRMVKQATFLVAVLCLGLAAKVCYAGSIEDCEKLCGERFEGATAGCKVACANSHCNPSVVGPDVTEATCEEHCAAHFPGQTGLCPEECSDIMALCQA